MVASFVASRKLWAECPNRGGFEIEIQLGVPYQASDVDWACAVGLVGLHDHLRDVHGIDSWQALTLAQRLVRTLLESFVEDDEGRLFLAKHGEPVDVADLFERGL